MTALQPSPDGTLLPGHLWVMRIGESVAVSPVSQSSSTAPIGMFELSSKDKASPIPRLSVFVEVLTLADEAWHILGSKPKHTVVACAIVKNINSVAPLEVQWEPIQDSIAPGVLGHCGIANLDQAGKLIRKELRSRLADQFRLSPVPVPHGFDEDAIQQVIASNNSSGDDATDRVVALRQMRRQKSASLHSDVASRRPD